MIHKTAEVAPGIYVYAGVGSVIELP